MAEINVFFADGFLDGLFKHLEMSGDYQTYREVRLYLDKLKEFGLSMNEKFKRNSIKCLKSGLFYLRPKRIRIYFTVIKENEHHLLSWYNKKSKKSPKKEIDRAINLSKRLKK